MKFFKNIFRFVFFILIIAMSFHGASNILWKARVYAEGFKSAHLNYETVRKKNSMPGAQVGIEAKSILPDDAVVKIFPRDLNLTQIAIRYYLFPIKIGEEETHIIDVNRTMIPLSGEKRELYNGSVVYAESQHGFVKKSGNFFGPSFFAIMFFAFFYTGWLVFVGAFTLCLMNVAIEKTGRTWFLATSYLAGYCIFTSLVWLYLVLGGVFNRVGILLTGGILSGTLLMLYKMSKRTGIQKVFLIGKDNFRSLKEKQVFLTGLGIFVLLAALFIIAISTPVRDWDGMSHWIMRAKVIFYNKQLVFDYTQHNYYPLLWPLNIAIQFELLGGMFDELAQWTSAIFFLVFIMQILKAFAVLGVEKGIKYSIAIVFIANAFQNPFQENMVDNFVISNAENIFLAYLCAALSFILIWLRYGREKKYLILAILMMCGLNLSKLEGGIASVFLIIALSLSLFARKIKAKDKLLAGSSLFTVLLPLGWVWWIKVHNYGSTLSHFQTGLSMQKMRILLKTIFHYSCMDNLVVLFILSGLYSVFYLNKRDWNAMEKFLLLVSAMLLLFACLANAGWPADQISTVLPGSFPRLFMHTAPILLLLLGSRLFSRVEER